MIDQPSLFEAGQAEGAPCEPPTGGGRSALPRAPWREVPQAVFLSWSTARQLSYCAARDRDAEGLDDGLAEFYRERAASYEALQKEIG